MPTISQDIHLVTTINVFRVAPAHQQRAFEMLTQLAQQLLDAVPGLLSASFHLSTDGERIVNYAQYDSLEAVEMVEAKLRTIALAEGLPIRQVTQPDFHIYTVTKILERA